MSDFESYPYPIPTLEVEAYFAVQNDINKEGKQWFEHLFKTYFTATDTARNQKNWTYNLLYFHDEVRSMRNNLTGRYSDEHLQSIYIPKEMHFAITANLRRDIWKLENLNRGEYYLPTGIHLDQNDNFSITAKIGTAGIINTRLNSLAELEAVKELFNKYIETMGQTPTYKYSLRNPTKRECLANDAKNLTIVEKKDFILPQYRNEKFYLKSEVDNMLKNIFHIKL